MITTHNITAAKADVETHFASHGTGKITEIKLMNGFGFIEYEDAMDARDVVPGKSQLLTSSSVQG
jgi:RNA recognition motif. (a.k.a. RRM, RBD, or RNP domain)